MTVTEQLYHLANTQEIPILRLPLPECGSVSLQDEQGHCYIGLDEPQLTNADERVCIAHELGHCLTGSFYNRYAARELRRKLENHADKWAIETLVPPEEYRAAIDSGCTELWQLAERFQITEAFARKVICWYLHGNLAVEAYDWPDTP